MKTRPRKLRKTLTRCSNCGRAANPLRRGECSACESYRRKYGAARPYTDDGRRERHPGWAGRSRPVADRLLDFEKRRG